MHRHKTTPRFVIRLSHLAAKTSDTLPRKQQNIIGLLILVLILLFTVATLADMLTELGRLLTGALIIAEIIILRRK